MMRLAAAILLLLASLPSQAGDLHPRRAYVGLFTALGVAGGGALGAALGGLQRSGEGGDSSPLVRWGLGGALFGGFLGYEIGQDDLIVADRATGSIQPGISGSSACLGAILGQLTAVGISAARNDSLDWDSRSVWANIALGTLLGASIGSLLPALRIIQIPPSQSAKQRELALQMKLMEPLLPEARNPEGPTDGQPIAARKSLISPPPASAEIMALDSALLPAGENRLIEKPAVVFGPTARSEDVNYHRAVAEIPPVIRSVVYLALLEGVTLGSAGAGATGDASEDFTARATVGGALGALAGFGAGTSFIRPWQGEGAQSISAGETIAIGERISGTLAGGLVGSILGAAAGSALRNSLDNFDSRDACGLALAGNLVGLLAGAILTGGLQPY